METVRVFIGTEPGQFVTQHVLADSIRSRTTNPVEIRFCSQEIARVGGTNFGFVRFIVPSLCGFEGKAIYLDADMVVLDDIRKLWDSLQPGFALAVVNDPQGFFGNKKVEKTNQTSVMVLNCGELKSWNQEVLFSSVVPNRNILLDGEIHYRDFLMLKWFDQGRIQSLDSRWNHFNIINPDTKLVHFSHVRSQPWRNPSHPLTRVWGQHLMQAIRNGSLSRWDLLKEIVRKHVHPWFLRYLYAP